MQLRIGSLALAILLVGCGGIGIGQGAPVPAGPLAPVIPDPAGQGADAECRGIPRAACMGFVPRDDMIMGRPVEQVERVIVTCIGRCTPAEGEVRIDLLLKSGQVISAGGGGYAGAPPAVPAPLEH